MPRHVPLDTAAASTASVRAPRYRVRMVLPSATVDATTGDPAKVTGLTLSHINLEVGSLDRQAAVVQVNLADPTLLADLLSPNLKGSTLEVWKYYELASPALVNEGHMLLEFDGEVIRSRGNKLVGSIEFGYPLALYPNTRINASGGFPMVSRPGIVVFNGTTIEIRRGGSV